MPGSKPADPAQDPNYESAVHTCPLTYKKSSHGGSTRIAVDDKSKTIYIESCMEFSGSGATPEYAKAAKKQIEETWSGDTMRNGQKYKVITKVNAKVNTTGTPTPGCDPIIVDSGTNRMDQSLWGDGPGHQTPAAANDAARPRRIAHEYGHTLGLDDGYQDDADGNSVKKDPSKTNDIMSETWPDENGTLPHPHQDQYDEVLKSHGW